ncbi:DUF5317 domain-containing protein [Desulfallas sp. Bu1-1]|uniref:DUF5317 domain-containing protein n=1 Tax=Desulfallas sp. Bu1-1 TaxID=2787620 RepID=UPI0018A0BD6C|nr:DUF5317 domain-containing protein [Desulfallas sp. Bu1-1]MBF7082439.1 DUF5317 domain-containing protein [Desulfallas sp. Bu1-1]
MFFLIIVIVVALIVIISGGKLENLKYCSFKCSWLVLIAVTLKIISISNLYQVVGLSHNIIPYLRVLSLLMVVLFVGFNYSLRGVPLVGLGLICNALVIILNGGNMPINAKFAHLTSTGDELKLLESGLPVNSFVLTSPDTKLAILSDIFLMPEWVPMTRLFSIGDVLITIGAIIFVTYYLKYHNYPVSKKYFNY